MTSIDYRTTKDAPLDDVLALYRANGWSAAGKPEALHRALLNSEAIVTAWDGAVLAGLGNAISDGHLVVYYPHLLVLPSHHGRGIGRGIVSRLQQRYAGFHQHMLIAEPEAVGFYERVGFARAGRTAAMWIYGGGDRPADAGPSEPDGTAGREPGP